MPPTSHVPGPGARPPVRIWFNRTFSSTYHAVTMIRNNPDGVPVEVFGTHESLDAVFLGACDRAALEPSAPAGEYVEFALDFVRRNRIEVFVPKRYAPAIADARADFAAAGARVLVAGSAAAMAAVSDKGALYAALERIAPGSSPRHRIVRTAAEFAAAHAELAATGAVVCFKPAFGEGGGGFRIIDDAASPLAGLAGLPTERLPLSAALAALACVDSFPALVVSECFTGAAEHSVDCLAADGDLLVGIPRRKVAARIQRIEAAPDLVDVARAVTREFALSSLFNVQFMAGPDGPKVIDVNPRMAAGIDVSAASGLNLPWLGIRLLLDGIVEIPAPRHGITVGRLDHLVSVTADEARVVGATGGEALDAA